MAKVWGPLHSDDASGTIGKEITYGKTRGVNWARSWSLKKFTRSELQDEVREWFKLAIKNWTGKSPEEQFLWVMAQRSLREYKEDMVEKWDRWGRCLFTHKALKERVFWWKGSPFPPSLEQMFAEDKIAGYNQLVADLETLTNLDFGQTPDPFFFPYLGSGKDWEQIKHNRKIMGIRGGYGGAIALTEPIYRDLSDWEKDQLVAHELTHCLLEQHRGIKTEYIDAEETICDECGNRVADGNLSPVYTHDGKTLSEFVRDSSFDWYNLCLDRGFIE